MTRLAAFPFFFGHQQGRRKGLIKSVGSMPGQKGIQIRRWERLTEMVLELIVLSAWPFMPFVSGWLILVTLE